MPDIVITNPGSPAFAPGNGPIIPAIVADAGDHAARRFLEFFAATIRNKHTRKAYAHAVGDFLAWCQGHNLTLTRIEPLHVAAYIERLGQAKSIPTVKQSLAAIRHCFDWLVTGQVLPTNPAASVRGPKYVISRGKTPVLTPQEARHLLDSIDTTTLIGLRDRAMISVMDYSFARVGAVVRMKVEDYYTEGRRAWFRLFEKGGKEHCVPAHHNAEAYVDAYIAAAGIAEQRKSPLFRSISRKGPRATAGVTDRPMAENDSLRMIKRRALAAGLPASICNHSCRATGITAYLENGGELEKARQIANHADAKTTKLYDRTGDKVTLDEVERISI